MVTMFSGCKDDQTSADAKIQGEPTGAMTWAFLETMKREERPSYSQVSGQRNLRVGIVLTGKQTLKMIRHMLDQSNYSQVPQLSSGLDIDLDDMGLVL